MLNFRINVDTNISIRKTEYPIYFEKRNICIHCGAEGTLTFVDKFGRETNKEIYPFDHIKCKKCGRTYSILWQKDSTNNKMFPCAVERDIKREFLNLINQREIKKDGVKELWVLSSNILYMASFLFLVYGLLLLLIYFLL